MDEYRDLRKKADVLNTLMGRVDAFCDYVNSQKFDIDREVCGAILGFDIKEKEHERASNFRSGGNDNRVDFHVGTIRHLEGREYKGNEKEFNSVSSYCNTVLHKHDSASGRNRNLHIGGSAKSLLRNRGDYGIAPELLMAVIETESRGQAHVENGGCYGLMQISKKWHKDRMKRLGVTDLYDERSNILVGADLLAELRDKYHESSLVLDIYHGDSKAFENYENGIVSDYARKILERSVELRDYMTELEKQEMIEMVSNMGIKELETITEHIPNKIMLTELHKRARQSQFTFELLKDALEAHKNCTRGGGNHVH